MSVLKAESDAEDQSWWLLKAGVLIWDNYSKVSWDNIVFNVRMY